MSEKFPSAEMNPREKSGQGLDYWAKELLDSKLITRPEYEYFCYVNSHKEEEIRKRGLPQLEHYGFFDNLETLSAAVDSKGEGFKFIIRCSNQSGEVKRLIDATSSEVVEFAKSLPGGFDEWKVELKEFTETKQSGTLIVSSNGNVSMEAWFGPHYLNNTDCPKFHASFINKPASESTDLDLSYKWSAPEDEREKLPEIQDSMLRVIKTFFPNVKPEEGRQIYVEYGVRPDNTIYFIEVNDSKILTDIN